jgi:hypothetical protein
MMHPGNRMATFLLCFLMALGAFIFTMIAVTDPTNHAAIPVAIVGGFGTLASAAIAAGALSGMESPRARWNAGQPPQQVAPPQAGYQQGGYPQQFGQPGQPPQGYAPPGGPQ